MKSKKWWLLIVLATVLLLYAFFDLGRYLSWAYFQSSRDDFVGLYRASPWPVLAVFFAVYVASTALSLPGATVLTLAAGALFGWGVGVVLVSLASTIGATLAMLVARYLLRDLVARRLGRLLDEVNKGIEGDGVWYLLSLRLMPVVPFFAINLLVGLTKFPTWTYFWVSQVGMLPATLLYVNAGTQIAAIESPADLASLGVLLSLTALALFPWVLKAVVAVWQRRRALAPWLAQRPRRFDRNLIVIGAGAAGLVSAYIATVVKAKVTLVEGAQMGGDCLNHGCVPSKALIKSARVARQLGHAKTFGLEVTGDRVNFPDLMSRVFSVIARIAPHDSVERYTGLGAEVLQGKARIIDPWHVEVIASDGTRQRLSTRRIVLASGASPVMLDIPGLQTVDCLTSETIWQRFATLSDVPDRLLIMGGGSIGCELAQAFARFGSRVTLLQRGPRLLPKEDPELSQLLCQALRDDGVEVWLQAQATAFERDADGCFAWVEHDGVRKQMRFDHVLCAVGRRARLSDMGLEALGIDTKKGFLQTNAYLQTSIPTIYAAGDVLGLMQHTHAASHQAWYATVNALFGGLWRFKADMRFVPHAVFVDPEVARVGLNEIEADAQGVPYEVTRFDLGELDRALVDGLAQGFVKVLTVPGQDKILGVTIVAAHAAELLAEYVLAMRHGLGLNKILATVHTYPTLSEANKYAAGVWKRAHAPEKLLSLVQVFHTWLRR